MQDQICPECGSHFKRSRSNQRYCSPRCAGRQRERRRRQRLGADRSPTSEPDPRVIAARLSKQLTQTEHQHRIELERQRNTSDERLRAALSVGERRAGELASNLQRLSQAHDRLRALSREQLGRIHELSEEVHRLRDIQAIDGQDLRHLAGRLILLARQAGVALDKGTQALFRRRGWNAAGTRS